MHLILFILFFIGCTDQNKKHEPSYPEGKYTWSSKPLYIGEDQLVVVNLGDLNLTYAPREEQTKEAIQKKSSTIRVGGIPLLRKYLERIRAHYGEKVIFVSPGNLFNKYENNELQYQLFKEFDVVINVSPSELPFLKDKKFQNLNLLSSNMIRINKKLMRLPTYFTKEINNKKIGFIGVTEDSLNENTLKVHYQSFSKTLAKSIYKAHRQKVDLLLILVYAKMECGEELARKKGVSVLSLGFNPQQDYCQTDSIIHQVTRLIPPNLVHGVFAAGPGHKVNHFINQIPVMKNPEQGKYLGKAHFFFSNKKKIKIFNPVKLCEVFFKDSHDCYQLDANVNHKLLGPVVFMGKLLQ